MVYIQCQRPGKGRKISLAFSLNAIPDDGDKIPCNTTEALKHRAKRSGKPRWKTALSNSNPPSSSTKTALFSRKGRFYFIFHDFLACLEFWIRALTTEQATDRKNQCSGGIEPPEHCAFQPVFAFLAAISCFISWISWASFSSHSSYVLAYTFRAMRFPLTTGEYRPSQRFSLIWLTQPVPGLRRWPL